MMFGYDPPPCAWSKETRNAHKSKQHAPCSLSTISAALESSSDDSDASEIGSEIPRPPGTGRSESVVETFLIDARDLTDNATDAVRDAEVQFEEDRFTVRVLARGHQWTWFSERLPFRIIAEESRFQISKTGRWICITLRKATIQGNWSNLSESSSSLGDGAMSCEDREKT